MDTDRQITLYDACHDTAARLQGLLLRLSKDARVSGNPAAAERLRQRRIEIDDELWDIDPTNEQQMRSALATWGDEIHKRIELPASA